MSFKTSSVLDLDRDPARNNVKSYHVFQIANDAFNMHCRIVSVPMNGAIMVVVCFPVHLYIALFKHNAAVTVPHQSQKLNVTITRDYYLIRF